MSHVRHQDNTPFDAHGVLVSISTLWLNMMAEDKYTTVV